ncbi:MAG: hypothetical protein ABF490_09825, partial [Lentilactobacillus hilgardii]
TNSSNLPFSYILRVPFTCKLTGITDKNLAPSIIRPNKVQDEKVQKCNELKFLNFWMTNVRFLDYSTPEIGLIEDSDDMGLDNDSNGKEYFVEKAKKTFGISDPDSDDIFQIERISIATVAKNPTSKLFNGIENILQDISEVS